MRNPSQNGWPGPVILPGRFILSFLLAFLAMGLAACADSTGPEAPGQESEGLEVVEVAFQQDDLILGGFVFNDCTGWIWESLPKGDPVLVDLYFPHNSPGLRMPRVHPADIIAVFQAGGEFVHVFNQSVIRARLPRATLNQLSSHAHLGHARSVPDPWRFDTKVTVGYAKDKGTLVKGRFQELGGVITTEYEHLGVFYGVISDSDIPSLLELGKAIHWTELQVVYCVG